MVEWKEGIAYRLGIREIHIHPCDEVASEELKVVLGKNLR